jgi:hypothetical protein
MTDQPDESGLISAEIAARLLMVTSGQIADLNRRNVITPVTKNPTRYRLVEVVQGYSSICKTRLPAIAIRARRRSISA